MAEQQKPKGAPVGKVRKAGRYKTRGEARTHGPVKAQRIARQREREALNKERRRYGDPTPWEARKAERAERRAALRQKGMLLKQPRNPAGRIIKRMIVNGQPVERLVECCKRCTTEGLVRQEQEREVQQQRATARRNKKKKTADKPKGKTR